MIPSLIMSIILISSTLMLITLNPLSMGLMILIIALFITMSTALFSSSWLAFLIFLIYISGMLVLFAYFMSLSPNQSKNFLSSWMSPSILIIPIMFFLLPISHNPLSINSHFFMPHLLMSSNSIILIILALSLLLTMIIIVKISNINKGPMRPFSQYV